MILKSYIVEQNIDILKKYQATLIFGENNGIKDDIKDEIKSKSKNCEILNIFEVDIQRGNLLNENISNQSLFSKKKIIFIQEASDKIFDKIEEALENEKEEIQIYIFADVLEKRSKLRDHFEKHKKLAAFACYKDNERTLVNYINNKLKGFKGITGEIVNMIINNSSMDRKIIKSELEKIKNFFIEKKINKEEVLEILNIKNDSGFDEIRDKALMGDKTKVNKLLSQTEILNEEAYFYLNILNQRIMRLYEIIKTSDGKNNYEQMLENLKPPIFWKDKPIIVQQLKKWNRERLEETLIKIGETEILMKKNSNLKNEIVIKDLIINLTNKAAIS